MSVQRLLILAAVLPAIYAPASLSNDLARGADSFDTNCAECHSLASPPRNKKGPSLRGIVGRPAAQAAGFTYSDALKASAIVWDRQALERYLTKPKSAVPGGKMKFDGLDDASERADLIEFLNSRP